MYKLITARTHYYAPAASIVMAVTITGSPTEDALQSAIQKAINKHEIFSNKVILDNNGDSFYLAIPPRNIELDVRKMTGKDDWKQLVNEQERIPFDFMHGELIRFILLKNEETRKLIVVASHLAGDGMAITFLIRDIMATLENPNALYDIMPVQLMDDFGFPGDSRLKLMMRFALKKINKSWNKSKKIFSYDEYLSMYHSYWTDRKVGIVDDIIEGSDLQNLILKCKEHHITLNTVIVTAFLLASDKENEVGMAVSVRPSGYDGMGNFASAISIQYEPDSKKSFWKNAGEIHKLVYQRLKKNYEKYFVLQFLKGMEPTLIDASYFSTFAGFDNKAAAKVREWFGYNENQQIAIGVSNLSKPKIPNKYGSYSIDNIEFVPPLLPNNKVVIGIVTVGNKMTVTMQYVIEKDYTKFEKAFADAIKMLRLETI